MEPIPQTSDPHHLQQSRTSAMPPPNTPEEGVLHVGASSQLIFDSDNGDLRGNTQSSSPTVTTSTPAQEASTSTSTLSERDIAPRPGSAARIDASSRSSQLEKLLDIDHQSLDYTEPVDETLQCPICRTPFYLPLTTKTCGHTFCAGCLYRAIELQPVCPIDRQPLDPTRDLYHTRVILDQLDRLKTKCPNRGCDHVCSRDRLKVHHDRYCDFTSVPCPDPTCDKRIARVDSRPEKGCLHKDTSCQYCSAVVMTADLEAHYDRDCSGHTTECEKCSATVVRHRLEKHLAAECPESQVQCKWHPYGCKFFQKRGAVEEHEQSCFYEAIAQLARDRVEERKEDRMIINDLKRQLAALRIERMGGLPAAGRPGMGAFVLDLDLNDSPRATPMPYNSAALGSPEDYMLAQFERMETRMEDMRKMMLELDGLHSMRLLNDTMRLDGQISEINSKVSVLGMHTTWLMNIQRQSRGQQQTGTSAGPRPPGPGMSSGSNSHNHSNSRTITPSDADIRQHMVNIPLPLRRNSDGRGENPPRL